MTPLLVRLTARATLQTVDTSTFLTLSDRLTLTRQAARMARSVVAGSPRSRTMRAAAPLSGFYNRCRSQADEPRTSRAHLSLIRDPPRNNKITK